MHLHSASSIPSIAATQAREEHERREHKWRVAAHAGLSHAQENEQQHAQLTQWRHAAQQQQGRIKVYAPDFIAALQQEADEEQKEQTNQTAYPALSPASKAAAAAGGGGRVVKKFGHARTASMVDLLFKEAQAEAAGHKEKLKENVQRNERRATELIRRDYDKLQQNVGVQRSHQHTAGRMGLSALTSRADLTCHSSPALCVWLFAERWLCG